MVAALRDSEGQLALEQRGGDQAPAALGADGVDGVDVGVAAAEGDGPVGMAARGLDQPVAVRRVVGNDRDAVGLEPLENLGLGVGDRFLRAEILDMRRGDRGDQSRRAGRTWRVSAAISPALFMPISNTAYSASRGIRARLSGTPV